jgi:hypothetical protein
MGHRVLLGEVGSATPRQSVVRIPGLTMPLETAARYGASVHVELRPAPLAPPPSTGERGVGVVIDMREASASARQSHHPSVRRRRQTARRAGMTQNFPTNGHK